MRHHRELFESVRKRTGTYFQQETYAVVAAFVCGYDAAYEYGMREGFKEWLVLRLGMGSNLVWLALVLEAAFPNARNPQDAVCASPDTERHAIEALFDPLAEFDNVRSQRNGLKTSSLRTSNGSGISMDDRFRRQRPGGGRDGSFWPFPTLGWRAEHGRSALVLQTSIFSAISIASSISMPR
jgi:hypothetical protein